MKPMLKNLLTICLVAFILSSCSNKNADLLIPKDAAMVMHINAASLSSKLTWTDIKNSEWFKLMNTKEAKTDFEKKLLDDPAASGIDMNSDMYLFMKPSGRHAYMAFQGKLKDVKAFEDMVKKMNDGNEIKKDGAISYTGEGLDFMTWTNERFMMVGETNTDRRFSNSSGGELTKDSMLNFAKATYNLKSSNSIGNNSKFNSVLNEKGDLHIWIDNTLAMRGNEMAKQLSFMKASTVFEGNSTGIIINFENGQIRGVSKAYYNKELSALYDKYLSGNLNTDMLKKIPGDNVDAVIAVNYKPEGIKAFLKLLGFDGLVDGYLTKAGLTLDDLINANKGDFMLAVSDFKMEEKAGSTNSEDNYNNNIRPDAKILLATSINNKGAFDKMIDAIKNTISKEGLENSNALPPFKYEIKDNWFIAGNSQENVSAYGSGNTDHPFISKISGHPFGAYLNIKKMVSGIDMRNMVKMYGMQSNQVNSLMGMWDDIVMYGGEMKDGAAISHFEINLTDKNTNSLKQLNSFLGTVASLFGGSSSNAWNNQYPSSDTLIATPPPAANEK